MISDLTMILISIRNKYVLDFEGNAVESQESYERQKARQRQMRHDKGLKPLGRPIKNKDETLLDKLD